MRYRISAVCTVVLSIAWSPTDAQQMQTNRKLTTSVTGACIDRVQLTGFTATPSQPIHGQQVIISATVRHLCSSNNTAASMPWKITVGSTVIGSGTLKLASGAQTTISARWAATLGTHELDAEVDPNNTLNEPANARNNNLPSGLQLTVVGDWNGWNETWKAATKDAVAEWFRGAALGDVRIMGSAATGGSLRGPSIEQILKSRLAAQGVPSIIGDRIAQGFNDAWSQWQSSVKAAAPAWYPAFLLVAGAVAPSTPNAPGPLALLAQNPESMTAPKLKESIQSRLGTFANENGAASAIANFAEFAAACFVKQKLAVVKDVMGTGTTAYSPQSAIAGPVVNGRGNGAPGHILAIPC